MAAVTIPSVDRATTATMIVPIVAPTIGTRSKIATIRPSAIGYGTEVAVRMTAVTEPATKLIRRLPLT